MPDWFQMKDILMQFKEEKRERDIFKEISRQAEMIFFFQENFLAELTVSSPKAVKN